MDNKSTIFLKQSKPIDFTLWLISFASWKFLAVTTSLAITGAASEFIYTKFPDNFNTAMTVCVMVFYVIIDLGIVPMMKFYWNFKDTTDPHQKKFINIISFFIILKIVISLTSSIWASPEAAGVITVNNKPVAEQKKNQLEQSQNAKIAKAETAWKDAKKNVKKEVKNHIQLNADRYQKSSIRNLGVDGWICHPSNKDKADIKLCKSIREIENKPIALKNTYEALLSDSSYDELVKDYNAEIINSGKDFKHQMNRRTGYFIWLDIIALLFGLGAEYMRHIRRKATKTNDVTTPTLFYIFGNFIEEKRKQILYWFEKKLDLDINKDGYKGNPKSYKSANSSYNIPNNSTVRTSNPNRTVIVPFQSKNKKPPSSLVTQEVQPVQEVSVQDQTNVRNNTTTITEHHRTTVVNNTDLTNLKRKVKLYYLRSFFPSTDSGYQQRQHSPAEATLKNNWEKHLEKKEELKDLGVNTIYVGEGKNKTVEFKITPSK